MNATAVDLFCGAGGLTYGLERAGVSVEVGVDRDPDSEFAYERNTGSSYRKSEIQPLAQNPERVARMFPWDSDLDILTACAPCQPYSTMGHPKAGGVEDHDKWGLLNDVKNIIEYVEPDVVVTENVLQVRHDETYHRFQERLEELGYFVNSDENKNVYCPEYGIPQKRKRWVMMASREGPISLPEPSHGEESEYLTVGDTIEYLPPIGPGDASDYHQLHRSRSLSDTNLERIRNIEPGQSWETWKEHGKEHLIADCHKSASGESFKAPYSRLDDEELAPTITTQFYNYGSGRFGHYDMEQNRALTLLEGALLQTFPEDFAFYDEWADIGVKNLGRLIGNAVPPRLGEIIGEAILNHQERVETELSA